MSDLTIIQMILAQQARVELERRQEAAKKPGIVRQTFEVVVKLFHTAR